MYAGAKNFRLERVLFFFVCIICVRMFVSPARVLSRVTRLFWKFDVSNGSEFFSTEKGVLKF